MQLLPGGSCKIIGTFGEKQYLLQNDINPFTLIEIMTGLVCTFLWERRALELDELIFMKVIAVDVLS